MASFFQPALTGDPSLESCGNGSHWKLYCNSVLPSDQRLLYSYQWLTFILAIVALGVPTVLTVGEKSVQVMRAWRRKRKRFVLGNQDSVGREVEC